MAIRDILDRQAGTIEHALHTHGIRAQGDGGKLSPRLAHFHLGLPPGLSPSRLAPLVPEIATALGAVSCRLAALEGVVYLEAPRPAPVPGRLLRLACPVAGGPPDALISLRWALRMLSRRGHLTGEDELTFDEDDGASEPHLGTGSLPAGQPELVILLDGADELCSMTNRRANA